MARYLPIGTALLLAACQTSPTGRHQLMLTSDAQMTDMGKQAFDEIKKQYQLGTVLGHETGHVVAQHGKERASEQLVAEGGLAAAGAIIGNNADPKHTLLLAALGTGTQLGVVLPFSRAQESEADLIGLDTMARAGFRPSEAIALWHNMEAGAGGQPPQFLSDHPSDENRITALQAHLPEAEKTAAASGRHPSCGSPP